MIALPKATSQGSNGAGGGAFMGFTAISAAKVDPAVIASIAAAKTSFFIAIPITCKTAQFRRPRGHAITGCNRISLTRPQFGTRLPISEAKKTSICRLFRRYGRSMKCCRRVLHSDNNFDRFLGRLPGIWETGGERRFGRHRPIRPNQAGRRSPGLHPWAPGFWAPGLLGSRWDALTTKAAATGAAAFGRDPRYRDAVG